MPTRQNIAEGTFYQSDFNLLDKQIESCFLHDFGPGNLPERRKDKTIQGVIVPHASYDFSGPCAAWAYKDIAESVFADTYILIGPTHNGKLGSSISLEDWQSAFGIVYTDKYFARELVNKTQMSFATEPHRNEHSLETQIPFLQFATKDKLGKLSIVAITLGDDFNPEKIKQLSRAIHETSKELNKSICLIVSSDFLHYGPSFGYEPFVYNVKDNIDAINGEIFDIIKSRDTNSFLRYIRQKQPTICGFKAIGTMMDFSQFNKNPIVLRQYYSSDTIQEINDNSSNQNNIVSYASFTFF